MSNAAMRINYYLEHRNEVNALFGLGHHHAHGHAKPKKHPLAHLFSKKPKHEEEEENLPVLGPMFGGPNIMDPKFKTDKQRADEEREVSDKAREVKRAQLEQQNKGLMERHLGHETEKMIRLTKDHAAQNRAVKKAEPVKEEEPELKDDSNTSYWKFREREANSLH